MTNQSSRALSITDLGALDQEILGALCKQESIDRFACYRISSAGATLAADTAGLDALPLPVHFNCSEFYHTAKSKILLAHGWQPIIDSLLKDQPHLKGWKAYLPVQDLWNSQVLFLIKKDGRRSGKTAELDGFLEALARRLHKWLATDELRHFIDDTTSQEHTHAFGAMLSQILSHELRNPLANLMALTATQELIASSDEQKVFIEDVSQFTKQIWEIVQKVELLIDVDSTAFQSHEKAAPLDVVELVKSVVSQEIALHEAQHADVKIILSTNSSPVFIQGVGSLLRLSIRELLKNAYEFGNGSPIKINAFQSGEQFILDVEEDGMAIPPGQDELIFLRYFQGSRAGRHKGPSRRGMGLGLFLARFVSKHHGGQLIFVRGGIGRKGLFRMILPVTAAVDGKMAS